MAGTWTAEKFPRFEKAIRRLTEQHRELKDEPLYLAVSYGPARDPRDIYLLQAIGNGPDDRISPDRELFETTFTPTAGFPMDPNQRLHLILTNPEELETALREKWASAGDFTAAVRLGDYQVLHADRIGKKLLRNLESVPHRKNGAARG